MKQIRINTFETNSSSTHSISFKFKKQQLPKDKLEISGNTVIVHGISQGDLYPIVSGERNKLDYILSWMYLRDDNDLPCKYWDHYDNEAERESIKDEILVWPGNLKVGEFNNQYKNILEAVQRIYPGIEKICLVDAWNCEFDHQTSPWEEGPIVDLDDPDEIYNYLFNDHLTIELGHD